MRKETGEAASRAPILTHQRKYAPPSQHLVQLGCGARLNISLYMTFTKKNTCKLNV